MPACRCAVAPLPLHTCVVSSACALRPHMSLLTTHSSVCRNVQLVSKLDLQRCRLSDGWDAVLLPRVCICNASCCSPNLETNCTLRQPLLQCTHCVSSKLMCGRKVQPEDTTRQRRSASSLPFVLFCHPMRIRSHIKSHHVGATLDAWHCELLSVC